MPGTGLGILYILILILSAVFCWVGNVIAPVLWARKLKLRRLYNLPKITQLKGGNVQAQHESDP